MMGRRLGRAGLLAIGLTCGAHAENAHDLSALLDRQADRAQAWSWATGQAIEDALRRGDGDRAQLERYVRESMTDWAVRCPQRVVAGAPLHVAIDATTARSALHSTMHVVVDDALYFVDDRLRAEYSEPRNGQVMRPPSARFAAPTEPGTYTLTVEALVGVVLTERLEHQRGAMRFREQLTRSMRDEVRATGVGPFPVRWTTTFDVVAPDDAAAFAIDDPSLADTIRQRVERLAIVLPPASTHDRRPTLDVVLHAPVPMAHDVIVRANGHERLVGAFRSLPWTRGEFRSELDAAQPWMHQLTLGTPTTWPDIEPLVRPRSTVSIVLRPNLRHLEGGWTSACWMGELVIDDVPVLTHAEWDARGRSRNPAAAAAAEDAEAAARRATELMTEVAPQVRAYRAGDLDADSVARIVELLKLSIEIPAIARDRTLRTLLRIAEERGDVDLAPYIRARLTDGHRLNVRQRLRIGESMQISTTPAQPTLPGLSLGYPSARLLLGDREVWRGEDLTTWPWAHFTVPEMSTGPTTLRLEITCRDAYQTRDRAGRVRERDLGTITFERAVTIVDAKAPTAELVDDPAARTALHDAARLRRAWIAHATDGTARAYVEVDVRATPYDVAHDVVMRAAGREWTIGRVVAPAGRAARFSQREWWHKGFNVSGLPRSVTEVALRLEPSLDHASDLPMIESIPRGAIDLGVHRVYPIDGPARGALAWSSADDPGRLAHAAALDELRGADAVRLVRVLRDARALVREAWMTVRPEDLDATAALRAAPKTGVVRVIVDADLRQAAGLEDDSTALTFGLDLPIRFVSLLFVTADELSVKHGPSVIQPIIDAPDLRRLERQDLPAIAFAPIDELSAFRGPTARTVPFAVGACYIVRSVRERQWDALIAIEVIDRDAWTVTLAWRVLEYTRLAK